MPTYPLKNGKKGGSVVNHDPIDPEDTPEFANPGRKRETHVEDFGNPRPEDIISLPPDRPDTTPDYIVASVEAETGIAEYAHRLGELRATRRGIEAEEESIRKAIIDHLESTGASQVFTASGQVAATLRISVRSSINRAKLEALYPEVFAQVVTATRVKSIWLP
jgi:hypothetical protein